MFFATFDSKINDFNRCTSPKKFSSKIVAQISPEITHAPPPSHIKNPGYVPANRPHRGLVNSILWSELLESIKPAQGLGLRCFLENDWN